MAAAATGVQCEAAAGTAAAGRARHCTQLSIFKPQYICARIIGLLSHRSEEGAVQRGSHHRQPTYLGRRHFSVRLQQPSVAGQSVLSFTSQLDSKSI